MPQILEFVFFFFIYTVSKRDNRANRECSLQYGIAAWITKMIKPKTETMMCLRVDDFFFHLLLFALFLFDSYV